MDFSKALKSLKNDVKIYRLAWDSGVYVKAMKSSRELNGTYFYTGNSDASKPDYKQPWLPTQEDLLAGDWKIADGELPKIHVTTLSNSSDGLSVTMTVNDIKGHATETDVINAVQQAFAQLYANKVVEQRTGNWFS
ncbi:hypothetical protein MUDAN_DOGOELCO_03236 [Lactiplantibacillus mudanjiangensis]|nr:hypothetical protein MUDAN_DOGOELCO_03236 [Lactiplantibacillus mudanjiangensis]